MKTRRIHFINFIRKFAVTTAFFLAPLHFLRLGFTGLAIGMIVSCFAIAPILLAFPTGWVNDRFSIKRVILSALILQGALMAFMALIKNPVAMAAVFLCLGFANSALDVSINSLFYKDESEPNPNRKYGIYMLWLSLGPTAGMLVGGILTFYSGYRMLLIAFSGLTLLSVFALRGLDGEKFSLVTIRDYRSDIFNRKVLSFLLLLFILALHWGVEGTVYSPFLRSRFALNDFEVASFISLTYLALTLSSLLVSRMEFNPKRNRSLFLLGMLLSGLGLALMPQNDVRIAFLFRFMHETGDGLLSALSVLYIAGLFEKRTIGGSAGILSALQTTGQMAGALVFSWIGYGSGLQYPFLIAGALLIMNAFFGLYALPQRIASTPGLRYRAATVREQV